MRPDAEYLLPSKRNSCIIDGIILVFADKNHVYSGFFEHALAQAGPACSRVSLRETGRRAIPSVIPEGCWNNEGLTEGSEVEEL